MDFSEVFKALKAEWKLKGKTWNAVEREKVYSLAYSHYQEAAYEKAAELFTLLVFHDPYEIRFWNSLAGAKQMAKDFSGALRAWGVMSFLGNHPPEAHFHAAECCLSLGELEEAKKALECAKLHLDKHHPLFDRIHLLYSQVHSCVE